MKTGYIPNEKKIDVLILDAKSRQALVVVRSLGKKGLTVAALENDQENVPAFSSKWLHLPITTSAKEATSEYLEFLRNFLKQYQVGVVIPLSDGTIELIRKHRKELSNYTTIALADEKALFIAVNKVKTLAIAQKVGIRIPQSAVVKKKEEIKKVLQDIPLPIVIKPNISWTENEQGAKRVVPELATTIDEVYAIFEKQTEFGGDVIFQQYLSGIREAVSVVYGKKQFYAEFAQWAKRTQPPLGGTSVLRQSIVIPDDLKKHTEDLIRAIDLEGYAEIEFRRDEKGIPYLMEINPRLSASVDVAVESGCDFPYTLYLWAKGEREIPSAHYKAGIWERYLAGDIINLVESLQQSGRPGVATKQTAVKEFLTTFLQPMKYDYVDGKDMKPMWNALKNSIIRNIKKIKV